MDTKKNQQPQTAQARIQVPFPPENDATSGSPAQSNQGKTRSEAPNASFETGAGRGAIGYDSPPVTSSQLSNLEVEGEQHDGAIYPPGGAPDTSLKRRYSEPKDNPSSEGSD